MQDIQFPSDLKRLKEEDLPQVAEELRQFIINAVSVNPGHFGASLGVVELTVALHYVFNTPYDQLVWDVGHQAYPHKILTGRKDQFHTNRIEDGISGFPRRSESIYDSFGVGHSSTSISAALGMAVSAKLNGENEKQVIAVIGDGSLTGGMAFEGLNNGGILNSNLLVILNDNHISIDKNVGAISEYLLDITTSQTYNKVKREIWDFLGKIHKFGPNTRSFIQKLENGIKSVILRQSNFFEALKFRYFGPIDGHDLPHMIQVFNDLKQIQGPKLLHIITKKGKGYSFAEINQTAFHATSAPFDPLTGKTLTKSSNEPKPPKFQDVFGKTILELAQKNQNIVAVTPAMISGSSLNYLLEKMPERVFDVGIAEQHAVTFSAGMATQGKLPFCNIYSTFMQRAYDQVIHDVALQNLQVVFCMDRSGMVGQDGATHHGVLDLPFMRCIPNMVVAAPMNEIELRNMMYTAQLPGKGTMSIRYPRGQGNTIDWQQPFEEIQIGKGRLISDGNDLAIITLGTTGIYTLEAVKILAESGFSIAHYDMRFLKPLDENLLHNCMQTHKYIITVEDGTILGGLGTAIMEFAIENGYAPTVKRLGVPDKFIEHALQQDLHKRCGYDVEGIVKAALNILPPKLNRNFSEIERNSIQINDWKEEKILMKQ